MMKIPNSAHESHPWQIREITADFTLEDVWSLPVSGTAEEFPELLEVLGSIDPADSASRPTRALWLLRDLLGKYFGLGRTSAAVDEYESGDGIDLPIPGSVETSLAQRLPDDLRGSVTGVDRKITGPFVPLYMTDDEFAAEISNATVHGVVHLGWVDQGDGTFHGQMAVYVKPRGNLGRGYMKLIEPFRNWIVYPALMKQIEHGWDARHATEKPRTAGTVML